MYEYDDVTLAYFLENQLKLFPEPVAETPEEAAEFLDICMAGVCKDLKEVREYLDGMGADLSGMSADDLLDAEEVFALPDGRYLVIFA